MEGKRTQNHLNTNLLMHFMLLVFIKITLFNMNRMAHFFSIHEYNRGFDPSKNEYLELRRHRKNLINTVPYR